MTTLAHAAHDREMFLRRLRLLEEQFDVRQLPPVPDLTKEAMLARLQWLQQILDIKLRKG